MDNKLSIKNYRCLLYVISCAVNNKQPSEEILNKYPIEQLYNQSKRHSISALVGNTIKDTDYYSKSISISKDWNVTTNKVLRKTVLMDIEREKIFQYMDSNGIWYAPLKGIILKYYYPAYGLREMSDNDILFDVSYQREMKDYMVSIGYDVVSYGNHQDDIYHKKPVYNFELHRMLFASIFETLYEYYADIKDKLIKDDDNKCGYHFSKEDFYVYIIGHAYEHYRLGGTGLRTLIDVYLYNSKEKNLDKAYIRQELKNTKLSGFERYCRVVSNKLFSKPELFDFDSLNEKEKKFLEYILGSGTYGNSENNIRNRLKEKSKNKSISKKSVYKYYLSRLFPDLSWYKYHKPFVYKHKILIPFYCVYRWIRSIPKTKTIIKEVKVTNKIFNANNQ